MKRVEASVVLKYCAGVDRFLKVRRFTPAEIPTLLDVRNVHDRASYRAFVINACVVNYNDEIAPRVESLVTRLGQREQLDEEVYAACVEINPGLDIEAVVLPVSDPAQATSELHLFEREPAEEAGPGFVVDGLAEALGQEVVGQADAIRRVTRAIQRAAAGLRDPRRPIGSFFFVGQTGVGKTQLAKSLARHLFDDVDGLVRIDCSEYAAGHEYAKLIGAPPGYVGHGEGGVLTEEMKRRQQAVVLFDEIEKADPRLHNLLLQLIDEGFISDGRGARVSCQRVLLIMTSNLGVREVAELGSRIGFGDDDAAAISEEQRRSEILSALRREFPPEFINRIDEIVFFNVLGLPESLQIVELQLREVTARAARRGIELSFTRPLRRHLAETGFDATYGARNLAREIRRKIEGPLAERIVNHRINPGDRVQVGLRRAQVYISRIN